MSTPRPRPGTAVGDRSVYAGRQLLGTIRSSSGGTLAFDPAGKVIGTFPNAKAATAALVKPGDRP